MATATGSRGLHIALWVVQVLLALVFLGSGFTKLTTPYETLITTPYGGWAEDFPAAMVKFIGLVEVLGAIGLIVPSATRIKPILTPLAAAGLVVVMLGAAGTHVRHGDPAGSVVFNLILATLAGFVAWGRSKKAPIAPRA